LVWAAVFILCSLVWAAVFILCSLVWAAVFILCSLVWAAVMGNFLNLLVDSHFAALFPETCIVFLIILRKVTFLPSCIVKLHTGFWKKRSCDLYTF